MEKLGLKSLTVLLVIFLCSNVMVAQHQRSKALGKAEKVRIDVNKVTITSEDVTMIASVYTPSIVRIRIYKRGHEDSQSYAVILNPTTQKISEIDENSTQVRITTDSVVTVIEKNPIRVKFLSKSGKVINEDEPAFGTSWLGEEVTTYKKMVSDEKFIGLGEKTGGLNRRGEGYVHWNTDYFGYPSGADPIYMSTPFYIGLHSSKGENICYGIFMDNSYKSHFNFGASNDRFSSFTAEDGEMNYYFISNSNVSSIISSYTELTGRLEMPPLWSLGFQQCRYSYYPDTEVLRVAQTFRDKGIPADVIYLDIHYMDAYKIFTWHPERFSKPKSMLEKLESNGFKTVVIVDPGIKVEKGYASYEEGKEKNLFLQYPDGSNYTGMVWPGWCHFPDFTNPKTRKWWGSSFKGYIEDGIDGFWNDMNEPATWGQKFPDLVEFDFEGIKGTHRKGHNIYGMQMSRATAEGTQELLKGKRPFILTRAGYSGVQRYSAVWTGDNVSSDDHMLAGVRLTNSMGLTGIPFVGMDVGGFTGNPSKELFARWISISSFQPLFRAHVAIDNKDQEPWSFGERVEEIAKNYIQFRYNLMPYMYSLFYQSSIDGNPVQKSLAIDYTFNEKIYDWKFNSQFLLGNSILVAPIVSYQDYCKVLLPANTWYDFHTLKKMPSGEEHIVESPIEKLPVFFKGASLIPMQSPIQSLSKDKPTDTLVVYAFWGNGESKFVYYEDDGNTYEFKKGAFYKRDFIFNANSRAIKFEKSEGSNQSKFKNVKLVFVGFDALKSGSQIKVGASKVELKSDYVNFLKPISNFDPIGKVNNSEIVENCLSVVIPFSSSSIEIQY